MRGFMYQSEIQPSHRSRICEVLIHIGDIAVQVKFLDWPVSTGNGYGEIDVAIGGQPKDRARYAHIRKREVKSADLFRKVDRVDAIHFAVWQRQIAEQHSAGYPFKIFPR